MIRCLIVEDETLAQDVIITHLRRMDGFELAGVCRNGPDAAAFLARQEVDLLFLDIRLPGMTGLHFLRSLPAPPQVILTTAYAEYAVESYEFGVIDYLLKPISFERFAKALGKIGAPRDHIFIKSNGKFFKVAFSEILYVGAMKDYCKIYTPAHTLITLQTMGEMEKSLPAGKFIRVHRSFIVPIAAIRSIGAVDLTLAHPARPGTQTPQLFTIPVGISYREQVRNLVIV